MANDKEVADTPLHEAYRSCLGAIALVVLSRADIAAYVQALQRRGAAPRMIDVKRCDLVIRYFKTCTCGIKAIKVKHMLKIIGFSDAACKALLDEPTGFSLR